MRDRTENEEVMLWNTQQLGWSHKLKCWSSTFPIMKITFPNFMYYFLKYSWAELQCVLPKERTPNKQEDPIVRLWSNSEFVPFYKPAIITKQKRFSPFFSSMYFCDSQNTPLKKILLSILNWSQAGFHCFGSLGLNSNHSPMHVWRPGTKGWFVQTPSQHVVSEFT